VAEHINSRFLLGLSSVPYLNVQLRLTFFLLECLQQLFNTCRVIWYLEPVQVCSRPSLFLWWYFVLIFAKMITNPPAVFPSIPLGWLGPVGVAGWDFLHWHCHCCLLVAVFSPPSSTREDLLLASLPGWIVTRLFLLAGSSGVWWSLLLFSPAVPWLSFLVVGGLDIPICAEEASSVLLLALVVVAAMSPGIGCKRRERLGVVMGSMAPFA